MPTKVTIDQKKKLVWEFTRTAQGREKLIKSMYGPIVLRLQYMAVASKVTQFDVSEGPLWAPANVWSKPWDYFVEMKKDDVDVRFMGLEELVHLTEQFLDQAHRKFQTSVDTHLFSMIRERAIQMPLPDITKVPKVEGGRLVLHARDYADLRKFGRDILFPSCNRELLSSGFLGEAFGGSILTSRLMSVDELFHFGPEHDILIEAEIKLDWTGFVMKAEMGYNIKFPDSPDVTMYLRTR